MKYDSPRDSFLFFLVDRKCISAGGTKFYDVNPTTNDVHRCGAVTNPSDTLQILYTLMMIANHSYLGVGSITDLRNILAATSQDGRSKTGKISLSTELNNQSFFRLHTKDIRPRVDVYVQYLRGRSELKAWRFIFQVLDPDFRFDLALMKFFLLCTRSTENKRGSKTQFAFEDKPVKPFMTKATWIQGLSAYTSDEAFWKTPAANAASFLDLTDPDNPARCSEIFTYERSNELIQNLTNVDPVYQLDLFAREDDRMRALNSIQDEEEKLMKITDDSDDEIECLDDDDFLKRKHPNDETDLPDSVSLSTSTHDSSRSAASGGRVRIKFDPPGVYIHPQVRDPDIFFGNNCTIQPTQFVEETIVIDDDSDDGESQKESTRSSMMRNISDVELVKLRRMDRMNNGKLCSSFNSIDNARMMSKMKYDECAELAKKNGAESEDDDDESVHPNSKYQVHNSDSEDDDVASTSTRKRRQSQTKKSINLILSGHHEKARHFNGDAETARLYWQELHQPDSMEMLQSILTSDVGCQGTAIAYKFIQNVVDNTTHGSLIRPSMFSVDPELTTFGNFIATDLIMINNLFAIWHLHNELLLMQISGLSEFDLQSETRTHWLMSGSPASGKSLILEIIRDTLTIEGLAIPVSVQTNRSMTGNEKVNGHRMIIDELNDLFTNVGQDKTGSSIIKEMLTRGIINTECMYVEDGDRVNRKTISERLSQHLAGTNSPFHMIAEPTRTRFGKLTVAYREVDEMNNQSTFKLDRMNEAQTSIRMYREKWFTRQSVSAVIYAMNRAHMIPPIDGTIAEKLMDPACKYLKEHGISVHIRDLDRILQHCKTVCLYDSINQVFFTENHFKRGEKFSLSQVLACIPMLSCTREHFWFGFSQMFQTIVNPFMDLIIDAIYSMICDNGGDDKYSVTVTSGKQNKTPDYNYYLLNVINHMTGGDSVMDTTCRMISQRMCSNKDIKLDVGNIKDFLLWLQSLHIDSRHYTEGVDLIAPGNAEEEEPNHPKEGETKIKVMYELKNGTRQGFVFSREFIDRRRKCRYMDILEGCIRRTMDPVPEGQKPRKIVLGESLRSDAPRLRERLGDGREYTQSMYLYHCMVEGPEKGRTTPVMIDNDAYQSRSMCHALTIMSAESEAGMTDDPHVLARRIRKKLERDRDLNKRISASNLDDAVREKWYKKIGYQPEKKKKEVNNEKENCVFYLAAGKYPYLYDENEMGGYDSKKRGRGEMSAPVLKKKQEKRSRHDYSNDEMDTDQEVRSVASVRTQMSSVYDRFGNRQVERVYGRSDEPPSSDEE